jgi:hypothetical protein
VGGPYYQILPVGSIIYPGMWCPCYLLYNHLTYPSLFYSILSNVLIPLILPYLRHHTSTPTLYGPWTHRENAERHPPDPAEGRTRGKGCACYSNSILSEIRFLTFRLFIYVAACMWLLMSVKERFCLRLYVQKEKFMCKNLINLITHYHTKTVTSSITTTRNFHFYDIGLRFLHLLSYHQSAQSVLSSRAQSSVLASGGCLDGSAYYEDGGEGRRCAERTGGW